MTPDAKHTQYADMEATWKQMRDTFVGGRAVKKAGSLYLPRLGGQLSDTDEEYKKYVQRAQFFGAVSRTVDTMSGHIFRKQPKINLPDSMEEYKKDIDMGGMSLEGMANNLVEEVLTVTRVGILVEYPQTVDQRVRTVEESRQEGFRPYITTYKAENIINWVIGRVNNASVLVNVFLTEEYEDEDETKVQIRELHLEAGYGQRVWRHNDKDWVVHEEFTPKKGGKVLNRIPFWIIGAKEGTDVQNPVLEGLSDTCIGFYRNSADYENALHVAGLPTPWVNGVHDAKDFPEMHIGSNTFLLLPPDAEAGFLQCGKDGVAALKEALDSKKQEMAAQGARVLESDKRMAESAEAHAIKRGGENSILASIAASVEMSLTKALQFMAEWIGVSSEVGIELNKDYLPTPMDSGMLREWNNSYLSGSISFETYFDGLIRGELVPENTDIEDERDRIAEGMLPNDDQ